MRATILNISNNILEICKSHLLVEYVFSGSIDKLDDKVDFKGRTAWLTVQSIGLEEGKKVVRFNLIMLDKENSDRSNELQIQSDCSQILIDIAGRLNQLPLNNSWLDITTADIEPFIEKHNGYLAGATMTFDYVSLEDYDTCNAPFDGSTPTDSDEYITYINRYLTCETLAACPTIIQIQEDIAAITGGTGGLTCATLGDCETIQDILTALANIDLAIEGLEDSIEGLVPYTGATQNVDLGEFDLKAGQFTLDTSPTGTAVVGTTRWNDTIGSTETTLKGGSVILKNGVDLVTRVVNKVSPNATLLRSQYRAVRVTGAQGQRLAVAYAQANNDTNSADTIGLVCEDIDTNQEGFIITVGQFEGINTTGSLQGETWNDGDVIYLSPTTPGGLTKVKPTGFTGHIVVIGYVEYAHANNGKLYVKIMNGWELEELHDVGISGVTNGQALVYNSSNGLWQNGVPTIPTLTYLQAGLPYVVYNSSAATTIPTTIDFTINTSLLRNGSTIILQGYISRASGSGTATFSWTANSNANTASQSFTSTTQYGIQFYWTAKYISGTTSLRFFRTPTSSFQNNTSVTPPFFDVAASSGIFTINFRATVTSGSMTGATENLTSTIIY